jgi:hypothetical protein
MIVYLIYIIIGTFINSTIILYTVFKFKKKLIDLIRILISGKIKSLEDGKGSGIEKWIYNHYNKYIPIKYRNIDKESGIENISPYWIERLMSLILSYRFWIYFILIYILLVSGLLSCIYLINIEEEDDDHQIDIINDFNKIYNFILSSNGTSILKKIKNQVNEYTIINYQNTDILWTKILDDKGDYGFRYLNITNILMFLKEWQEQNKRSSYYCFCPVFIGIINTNIHFYYKNKEWNIIYNFTTKDVSFSRDKKLSTMITYNNKELEKLNYILTEKYIKHGNDLAIKYYTSKQESKEILLNTQETICFNHCTQINT